MRDYDVRIALRSHLGVEHRDDPSTKIVEELGLCEEARIDFAVINGSLTGFELKSARDTLARLPRQAATYSRVFDFVHLVSAENHVDRAVNIIPPWWGIVIAMPDNQSRLSLHFDRAASENPSVDPYSIVQLLWRTEALAILTRFEADRGVRSCPREAVWGRLVETLSLTELRTEVRNTLKARRWWRENPARRGNAATSQLSSKTPRFLARRIR
jgi:hypothetical protein